MYQKAYGIIETLAPLHVGASSGEESGNLNLIFRDQFTQTGIIPGSSIRGRFRTEMRLENKDTAKENANYFYGHEAELGKKDSTTEALVKFEYASIIWLPVFCPGQPVVWVSCPRLLKRYQKITGIEAPIPAKYTGSKTLDPLQVEGKPTLFFNFGFLTIDNPKQDLKQWFPLGEELPAVVVGDDEISMIHDMALYRQSRVRLQDEQKLVHGGGFFNTEALPEGTQLIFAVAIKPDDQKWQPFGENNSEGELYFGGLESIGFGHCSVTLTGQYFQGGN